MDLKETECDHPKDERHGTGYLEFQYCLKCGKELTTLGESEIQWWYNDANKS